MIRFTQLGLISTVTGLISTVTGLISTVTGLISTVTGLISTVTGLISTVSGSALPRHTSKHVRCFALAFATTEHLCTQERDPISRSKYGFLGK